MESPSLYDRIVENRQGGPFFVVCLFVVATVLAILACSCGMGWNLSSDGLTTPARFGFMVVFAVGVAWFADRCESAAKDVRQSESPRDILRHMYLLVLVAIAAFPAVAAAVYWFFAFIDSSAYS
jgi:hypothetical protein